MHYLYLEQNNVLFYEYDNPSLQNTGTHKVTWQRWFDLEQQLTNLEWDKVAVVDASYMIRWDTPNFFEKTSKNLSTFRSLENIKWQLFAYSQMITINTYILINKLLPSEQS